MREIVTGVWTWAWPSPPHGYDFNGHLVLHSSGNICIDPVELSEEAETKLVAAGVATIALTNRNHVRAANRVRQLTGARTLIHPADAAHAHTQGAEIDGALGVGDEIGPLRVVGTPGKSPGEVAFFWPARRLLIVGDAVIGNPPQRLSLLREKVMDDPNRLRASVRALLDVDFDTLLAGDGVSILADAKARLRELIDSFPARRY
jgi:glyoxylase-like metal-dependent hydrolase (beta-lactamase superfamily II)